jgi:hypothetical protein
MSAMVPPSTSVSRVVLEVDLKASTFAGDLEVDVVVLVVPHPGPSRRESELGRHRWHQPLRHRHR